MKTIPSDWFSRVLYRSYRDGGSLGFFVRRRITPTAWFLIAVMLASIMMGGNLRQGSVIILSAFIVGMLTVAALWTFLRRAEISAVRILPATGSVGEEMTYRVRLTNQAKFTLRDVKVFDSADDPRPSLWEFQNLKEPGEDERNIFDRIFIYYRWQWLMERGGKWLPGRQSQAVDLESGEEVELRLSLIPKRRGVIQLHDLRALMPDPFGLFQRCRSVAGEVDEVLVYPERYRLPPLSLQGHSELRLGGETASTRRGEGGEFLGLREYRPGDPMRKIHWKSWARTGKPVVKEHEENHFSRYGLILDTSLEKSGVALFEECVCVAAGFVSTMDRERCLLDLMFVQNEPQVFTAGRGVARADLLMDVLARVEATDDHDYHRLEKLIARHSRELTAAVVVLSGWDDIREEFLHRMRVSGLTLHVFAVVPTAEGLSPRTGVHWLVHGQVERDLIATGSIIR